MRKMVLVPYDSHQRSIVRNSEVLKKEEEEGEGASNLSSPDENAKDETSKVPPQSQTVNNNNDDTNIEPLLTGPTPANHPPPGVPLSTQKRTIDPKKYKDKKLRKDKKKSRAKVKESEWRTLWQQL